MRERVQKGSAASPTSGWSAFQKEGEAGGASDAEWSHCRAGVLPELPVCLKSGVCIV